MSAPAFRTGKPQRGLSVQPDVFPQAPTVIDADDHQRVALRDADMSRCGCAKGSAGPRLRPACARSPTPTPCASAGRTAGNETQTVGPTLVSTSIGTGPTGLTKRVHRRQDVRANDHRLQHLAWRAKTSEIMVPSYRQMTSVCRCSGLAGLSPTRWVSLSSQA